MLSTPQFIAPPPPPPFHSIVEYFYPPESEGHQCGYCKRKDTNLSHGMWAHSLSHENYESLINVGWRRSGSYVYKPMNDKICCPMIPIRNKCNRVEVSRSQRKVLKRFRKFLVDGERSTAAGSADGPHTNKSKHAKKQKKTHGNDDGSGGGGEIEVRPPRRPPPPHPSSSASPASTTAVVVDNEQHSDDNTMMVVDDASCCEGGSERINNDTMVGNSNNSTPKVNRTKQPDELMEPKNSQQDNKKSHPLKKKFLRRERKRQKLVAKGIDPDEFFRRNDRDRVRELSDFFSPPPPSSSSPSPTPPQAPPQNKHRFTTKLVQVDTEEFESDYFEVEHALYQKYQMSTHGDTAHECRASQFKRFLCDNPFASSSMWGKQPPTHQRSSSSHHHPHEKQQQLLGTYHQHYYIDTTLFAVGVIDLLPHCVSSVYFFYDPEFSFLSPGTLGALHEIAFVNSLQREFPQVEFYYLGFYIHSCEKMKYKRRFRPCQLVCPVTMNWVPFDDRVLRLLDESRGGFTRLAAAADNDDGDDGGGGGESRRGGSTSEGQHDKKKKKKQEDVNKVLLLYKRRVYSYALFPYKTRDRAELQLFVNLVTSPVASNMLVYRAASPPSTPTKASSSGSTTTTTTQQPDDNNSSSDEDDDDDDDED